MQKDLPTRMALWANFWWLYFLVVLWSGDFVCTERYHHSADRKADEKYSGKEKTVTALLLHFQAAHTQYLCPGWEYLRSVYTGA